MIPPSKFATEEAWLAFYTEMWWRLRRGQRKKMVRNQTTAKQRHEATYTKWLYHLYYRIEEFYRSEAGYRCQGKWRPPKGSY